LNITSILLKKVILEADSETWSRIRRHYLPSEYQGIYGVINKYFEDFSSIPSFDALKLSIRSNVLLDKVYAIQLAEDVDIDNAQLLEFLKNEYTQEEIMEQLSIYLEESIMTESAKENVEKIQDIVFHIEERVDLKDYSQDMQRIELFQSEEELKQAFTLGLNADYDSQVKFNAGDYILIGGRRGAGKSLTCANMAVNTYNAGRSSIYFTIEMSSRATLQRMCSIATGVSAFNLRNRNLSHGEWQTVAKWWSDRFDGGVEAYNKYKKHNDFDKLHSDLIKCKLLPEKQLDIVYDPSMTLATIRSELDKKVAKLDPAVILVDYVNQVKRSNTHRSGQYDWTEQIEVSKALKAMAQEYERPVVSPYQTDATGEARFAKGLLDAADAAFAVNAWTKQDNCITFDCVKMRDYEEISFTSHIDWKTLKIGPESAISPSDKEKTSTSEEDVNDI
jgi:replicative DNA helicase